MGKAKFHLGLLRNYQMVNVPGTYVVAVAYTINNNHLILDDYPRYLIPLRAITSVGLTEISEAVKIESEIINFEDVRHCFLTGALWFEDVIEEDLPIKGEKVLATFDIKDDKLMCTHIELLPREELDYIDINNLILFRKTLTDLLSKETN